MSSLLAVVTAIALLLGANVASRLLLEAAAGPAPAGGSRKAALTLAPADAVECLRILEEPVEAVDELAVVVDPIVRRRGQVDEAYVRCTRERIAGQCLHARESLTGEPR